MTFKVTSFRLHGRAFVKHVFVLINCRCFILCFCFPTC